MVLHTFFGEAPCVTFLAAQVQGSDKSLVDENRQRSLRKSVESLKMLKILKKELLKSTTLNPDIDVMKTFIPEEDNRTDRKMSNQTVRDAYPWFMFARRSDIERQCGFLLAGRLFLDKPRRKGAALPKSASPEVQFIVEELIEAAESGSSLTTRLRLAGEDLCRPTPSTSTTTH
jgi:hypothetical protein